MVSEYFRELPSRSTAVGCEEESLWVKRSMVQSLFTVHQWMRNFFGLTAGISAWRLQGQDITVG